MWCWRSLADDGGCDCRDVDSQSVGMWIPSLSRAVEARPIGMRIPGGLCLVLVISRWRRLLLEVRRWSLANCLCTVYARDYSHFHLSPEAPFVGGNLLICLQYLTIDPQLALPCFQSFHAIAHRLTNPTGQKYCHLDCSLTIGASCSQ